MCIYKNYAADLRLPSGESGDSLDLSEEAQLRNDLRFIAQYRHQHENMCEALFGGVQARNLNAGISATEIEMSDEDMKEFENMAPMTRV